MGLSRSDALSIGRGVGAVAVQGIVAVSNTTPIEIIAGETGKTLYLNYISISISDAHDAYGELTDGSGGTAFWKQQLSYGLGDMAGPAAYMLNYGEYGLALTEGNGLFGTTSTSGLDYIITALGCWR